MSTGWPKPIATILSNVRDFALTILIVGGAQVLVALLLSLILFRAYPQGFSMALSLVGFASWLLSSLMSFRRGRRPTRATLLRSSLIDPPMAHPVVDHVQAQLQRAGCGFVLFLSSIIPLGLAFILRVRADLRTGMTWSDLFPPLQ